jgi:hypothetical protein
MAYSFVKTLNGSQEVYEDMLLSNVSVAKGEILYNASGYATNGTPATCTTQTILGVTASAVDNSGGSAGDKSVAVQVNREAVFEAPSEGTLAQSQVWTDVDATALTTFDEDDPKTADSSIAGIIRIRKLITTAKGLVNLNFSPTGE